MSRTNRTAHSERATAKTARDLNKARRHLKKALKAALQGELTQVAARAIERANTAYDVACTVVGGVS